MGPSRTGTAYVGVGQMGGQGTFHDPRIGLFITQTPDLVTPKLPALLDYQLSLRTPEPPKGSFDRQAANRGRRLFRNEAGCATCHQGPTFTDVLSGPYEDRAVPARPGRSRDGSGVCLADRHREVPHDAAARTLAASAVFP